MRYEYNYTKIKGRHFPLVPITLITAEEVNTFALVDSGASISVFKPSLANQLGVEIEKGKEILSLL